MESFGVVRVDSSSKIEHDKPKPPPSAHHSLADERSVLEESLAVNPELANHEFESDEELRKPGLSIKEFKSLKKGQIHREGDVYVRGYTVEEASGMIHEFLKSSVLSGKRCVKIIHGKGLNSPDGISKIKLKAQSILARNQFVLGYCKAQLNDGGSGAKYVLLKKR